MPNFGMDELIARTSYQLGVGEFNVVDYLSVAFTEEYGWVVIDHRHDECEHPNCWTAGLDQFDTVCEAVRLWHIRQNASNN